MTIIYAKETVTCEWTFFLADEAGQAIDLTGCALDMHCRLPHAAIGDNAIELATVETDVEGLRIVDALTGEVAGRIDFETLQGVPDTTGNFTLIFDVVVTRPDGTRFSPGEDGPDGEIRVRQGVTYVEA